MKSSVSSQPKPYVPSVDRTTNVVITGVAEYRYRNVWRNKVREVLRTAAGRDIDIVDAFRLSGQFNACRTRPILVKLHSVMYQLMSHWKLDDVQEWIV